MIILSAQTRTVMFRSNIFTILEDYGFLSIWVSQVIPCGKECFKQQIKLRLLDQIRQKWAAEINQSSKCLNYEMLKHVKSNFKI